MVEGRGRLTSYASGGPDVDFYSGFIWYLVSSLDFDRAVDCSDDGVAILRVGR